MTEHLVLDLRRASGSLKTLKEVERELIELHLKLTGYNINRASQTLNISNSKLYKRYSPGLKSKMHAKAIKQLDEAGFSDIIRETVRAL